MDCKIKYFSIVLLFSFLFDVVYSQKPFYCGAPLPNPSENTDGLTLKMVQVITRHGDRTPLYTTYNTLMDQWNCDLSTFESPSLSNNGDETNVNYLFRKVYMEGREEFRGNCSLGQLTNIGYQQHLDLGAAFRELYVYKYQLLSEELDESEIWIRSTDVPRTLQSAQGHINGLYPINSTKSGLTAATVFNINTMDSYFENMYPNPTICPILNTYYYNQTLTPPYKNFTEFYQPLANDIIKLLDISSFPSGSWGSVMDLFFASQCHSLPLPEGVTEDIVTQTYEAAVWQAAYEISSPPFVSRLSMASFLEEIFLNIQQFIQGTISTKYFIFSGHDSTVGPLMNLFQTETYWPPYASHVEFELWEDDSSNQYIQLKYNGQSTLLTGCSSVMCEYSQFISVINEILIPNYDASCQFSSESSN